MLRKLVRLCIRTLQRVDRFLNHAYAELHGYFWKPCPACGEYFGGHELMFQAPLCEAKLRVGLGKIRPEMLKQ